MTTPKAHNPREDEGDAVQRALDTATEVVGAFLAMIWDACLWLRRHQVTTACLAPVNIYLGYRCVLLSDRFLPTMKQPELVDYADWLALLGSGATLALIGAGALSRAVWSWIRDPFLSRLHRSSAPDATCSCPYPDPAAVDVNLACPIHGVVLN